MSDINDDLLNYELGDLDDTVLAVDEDELLQSDDESSPTKMSQQEEALLLDEDDILICPPDTRRPEQLRIDDIASEPMNVVETRDDSVTTTTPEPTTSQHHATDHVHKQEPDVQPVQRTPAKRSSETREVSHAESPPKASQLRVDAPDFVPAPAEPNMDEVASDDLAGDTMSFVSTSTDFVDILQDDDIVSSQRTTADEMTESSISLSIMNEDELDVPVTTDENRPAPSRSLPSDTRVKDGASSTGPDESDSDFTSSQTIGASSLLPEMETEDSDDGNERLNPKHRVERERDDPEDFNKAATSSGKQFHRNPHRGGGGGGNRGPGGGYPGRQPLQRFPPHQSFNHYQPNPNENFNPQFPNQFRPVNDRGPSLLMNPHTLPVGSNPPLLQYRGHLPPQHPNFRPMYNPDGNRPRMAGQPLLGRHQRPDFHTMNPNNQPPFRSFNGGHGMRPGPLIHNMAPRFEMNHRPRMMNNQNQQLMQNQFIAPRGGSPHQPNLAYGGNGGPTHGGHSTPGNSLMGVHRSAAGASNASAGGAPASGGLPIIPRKVLINPNFKGGVEAATNQLMMDTLKNPQYMPPAPAAAALSNHDAELLRQQEAFINQNRRHIEKRRHERSPEREHRDRSYSPQRRERRAYSRDRDANRKPTGAGGAVGGPHRAGDPGRVGQGRDRRASSREPKRRRSTSMPRDGRMPQKEVKEPEDDETKAYRLMIEKQKSQREKLLKDKEMRRRQAAEGVKGSEDTKHDEPSVPAVPTVPQSHPPVAQKLTPIVVTEKKIISLKKKEPVATKNTTERAVPTSTTPSTKVIRNIPTAKVFPESKRQVGTTAVVKPVPKSRPVHSEFEDEDELLADSPSTSPTPGQSATQKVHLNATQAGLHTSRFANRRVVLKTSPSAEAKKHGNTTNASDRKSAEVPATGTKRVFDRLDRKVMNVTDASKRKIQRIVIQNTD